MTQQDDRPLAGPAAVPRQVTTPGHFGGVPEMARRTGAPVFAADARRGDRVPGSGAFDMNGLRILDPDGRVDQMITSLGQIRLLLDAGAPVILPGHGPVVTDPAAQLALALTAREARLAQHEAAVRAHLRYHRGLDSPMEIDG